MFPKSTLRPRVPPWLELTLRLSLPLATLDRELRLAAQAEGLPLLGI